MVEIILWALLTGMVTGGVWLGIVLARRADRLPQPDPAALDELGRRLSRLESLESRLLELEERLDFAERQLARQRTSDRLPPPVP